MSITFSYGSSSAVVDLPDRPYEIEIRFGVHVVHRIDEGFSLFDDGIAYDHRICKCRFTLASTDALTFVQFLRLGTRGETCSLALGGTATGFFPFGPDKGDLGTFTVRVLSFKDGPRLFEPLDYVPIDVEMLMVTAPAYTAGAATSEGSFTIGTVSTLQYPQNGVTPTPVYRTRSDVTRGGSAYAFDVSSIGDRYTSQWVQSMNTLNAAALTSFLLGATGRAIAISIIAPVNYYLFGVENVTIYKDGIYTVKLINGDENGSVLNLTAVDVNRWELPLRWYLESSEEIGGIYVDGSGITIEHTTGQNY